MAEPSITTPLDVLACGKRQLEALLDVEPNKRIRAVLADQLAEYLRELAEQLKNTPLRPSQELRAVEASRALAEKHDMRPLVASERKTPVVEPPTLERPIIEGEVTNRHPGRER